ncbi:MAG: hypothetical protein OEM38_02230 [Gammaproteobacteria bacterium]|nr:hypothetical protein [Gammaproteobacteria bacterium]
MSSIYRTLCALIFLVLMACSASNPEDIENVNQDVKGPLVSAGVFGANYGWENLAGFTIENGDLLRDRSFRSKADLDNFNNVWGEINSPTLSGSIIWNTVDDGDINPSGGNPYAGYVELHRTDAGNTCIIQQTISGLLASKSYIVNFSSFGIAADTAVDIYLYDLSYNIKATSNVAISNNSWTQHNIPLTLSEDVDSAIVGICLSQNSQIKIDEVRLSAVGEPAVIESLKLNVADIKVKSLRWPGGTLGDWFFWKKSIGNNIDRGELQAYSRYETPALGLHEFLNFCEEYNVTALVQINALDSVVSAQDIVEYIFGSDTSTQGAIRSLNGRAMPWSNVDFEIGNEPSVHYTTTNTVDTALDYAALGNAITTAMKAKATDLDISIRLGAISEASFQLADWLSPTSSNDTVKMLALWNSQVFDDTNGISNVDFTHAHFYSSRYTGADEESTYWPMLSGGALLKRTIDETISPHTGALPIWVTEYRGIVDDSAGTPVVSYLKDYQSGLAVADIMFEMIIGKLDHAYVYSLVDAEGFGMIQNPLTSELRPTAHVFKLLSVAGGEERIPISVDNTETYTFTTGVGNIPSGLIMSKISVFATRNLATNKPRVFLINRDYSNNIQVTLTTDETLTTSVTRHSYTNTGLSANNESGITNVNVVSLVETLSNPNSITVPAKSVIRLDYM